MERRTYEKQSTMASPPPFEGLWVSTDAGEVDKIPKQEDRRIADPGCHINPGSEAVPKQRCIDGRVRDGGKGGGSEHPVKGEVWVNKRPFYGGTVAGIVALSGLEVEETIRINDQRTKVAELQKHGISKTASLADEKTLTRRVVVSIIGAPITIKYRTLLQKLTKARLDWDEPLQGELAKEAGAVLEEMMLMNDGFCPRSVKPARGKGRPEVCECWGGDKIQAGKDQEHQGDYRGLSTSR